MGRTSSATMSQELFYTSAPRGLKPGTSGFCTVAMTRGLPAALAERLESLSGYRPLFPATDARAAQNPVSWAHWRINSGSQTLSVLSRICFAGLDHTQRSNKFAHHLVLSPAEPAAGGPAWVMSQRGTLATAWNGNEPEEHDTGRSIPQGDSPLAPCRAWATATGDAGWAGALVEAFLVDQTKPAYLIYLPGEDVLPLLAEALTLLPVSARWTVTFNTYFTDLPAGLSCAWRCCVAGTPSAKEADRATKATGSLLIDLTQPLGPAPDSAYSRAARTGIGVEAAPAANRLRPLRRAVDAAASVSPGGEWGHAESPRDPLSEIEADPLRPTFAAIATAQPRARSRVKAPWRFWVVAILWPLGVACVAWTNLHRHHTATLPHPPPVSDPSTDDRAKLVAENKALNTRLTAAFIKFEQEKKLEFDKGQEAARAQPPDPKLWVRRSDITTTVPTSASTHNDVEFAALADELRQAREGLAKARAAATQPAAAAPLDAPAALYIRDEDGRVLSQVVALPDAPRKADAPIEQTLAAWPGVTSTRLALSLPTGPQNVYRVKNSGDGTIIISRSSASGLGGELERARLTLSDGMLKLKWTLDDKDDRDARGINSLLMFATLRITDNAGGLVANIQFADPQRIDFSLTQRKQAFKRPILLEGTLTLVMLSRPPLFTAVEGGGAAPSISFRGTSGATFSIDADTHGISTNWADMLIEAARLKKQLDDEVESTKQPLPKTKKGDLDATKRIDDHYKTAFAAYDQATAKVRQQAALFDELNRPFRATAALRLVNGPVLATIEVTKEPPKAE